MLVHGFCFFKLVFIGPKELNPTYINSHIAYVETTDTTGVNELTVNPRTMILKVH